MATGNFSLYQGDTKEITVTVLDADDNAVDITSATISWKASRNVNSDAELTKDTTSGGVSITDASGGKFKITITAGDTARMNGDYYHEAQITFSDGSVSTVLTGTMTVRPGLI